MKAQWQEQLSKDAQAVQLYTWERIGDYGAAEQRESIAIYEAARLLNFRFVKQHEFSIEDINLLLDPFPSVTAEVISNLLLVLEKDEYYIVFGVLGSQCCTRPRC